MKSKRSRYLHYSNRQAIIASLSGVERFIACTACINWARCGDMKCQYLDNKHYKPVKIRKVIMKKIIKRRKCDEK